MLQCTPRKSGEKVLCRGEARKEKGGYMAALPNLRIE
jgi:hypothetical protein